MPGADASLEKIMSSHVTPAFESAVLNDIATWEKSQAAPAFARVFEQTDEDYYCKNCAGDGQVYIAFCAKGPAQIPNTIKKPSLWFDGNNKWGKGWYLTDRTVAYPCSHCNGQGIADMEMAIAKTDTAKVGKEV